MLDMEHKDKHVFLVTYSDDITSSVVTNRFMEHIDLCPIFRQLKMVFRVNHNVKESRFEKRGKGEK